MARFLKSSVAVLAVMAAVAQPAQAAMPVIDIRAVGQMVTQVNQLKAQLETLNKQYAQMQQTYGAIAHAPKAVLNQVQGELRVFRNPLNASSGDVASMIGGTGLGQGQLGSKALAFLRGNRVYAPTGGDFQAQQLNRNAVSIAGAQAMASELYQSANDHVDKMQDIEGQLSVATDAKEIADLQARLTAEQTYFQAQQVQAQSIAMMQAAQERNDQQRKVEHRRQQVDQLLAAARERGGF